MKTETTDNAERAAHRLMKERGYLIIGFPADESTPLETGQRIRRFAGTLIPGHVLRVTGPSDFESFRDQAKYLGIPFLHKKADGQRFFTALLESVE